MHIAYNILLVVAVIIAVLFTAMVFFTGKGDAMSGSGGIRTTFKGKASFDDIAAKLTFYLGITFMGLMVVLDIIANRMPS